MPPTLLLRVRIVRKGCIFRRLIQIIPIKNIVLKSNLFKKIDKIKLFIHHWLFALFNNKNNGVLAAELGKRLQFYEKFYGIF